MGMIVELLAVSPVGMHEVDAHGVLVGSLSVNSLAVAEFFNAIASTELASLIGDGADGRREIRLQDDRQSLLMGQIQPWAVSGSELLVQAFDAMEAAVEEVWWRSAELLVRVS